MPEGNLFYPVGTETVLRQAIGLVSGARKIIRATMLLSEEVGQPIPSDYYNLLKKKMDEGVSVVRLGFGSKKDFDKINLLPSSKGVNFIRIENIQLYQRMLIQDETELIFAIDAGDKRFVFFSDFPMFVQAFIFYFDQLRSENKTT